MLCSESFSVSMIRRDEIFVSRFGSFGRKDRRRDQNPVAKGDACVRNQRKIQLLFTIAENFLAEWICREESVTACVPIRRKSRILRVIENRDGDRFFTDKAAQIAPVSTSPPGSVSFFTLTCKIGSVDAGIVQLGDRGGAAAGIRVHLGLIRGNFQRTNNA